LTFIFRQSTLLIDRFLLETLAHEEHLVETYKKSTVEFKNRRVLVGGGVLKSQKVTLSYGEGILGRLHPYTHYMLT